MIDTLVNVLDPIAIFLLDATIKTTLFMGLVLLAVWLLGTRQAAKRSLFLNWCLVCVLVIPIASLCMPSLRFQFDAPSLLPEPALPTAQPVVVPDKPLAKSTSALKQQKGAAKALSQDVEFSQDFVSPSPAQIVFAKNASTKSIDWTPFILFGAMVTYAIGVLIFLIRIIHSLIQVRTFRRSLLPCEDEQLWNDLQVLKNQLGIRRFVALAISDKIGSPTQVGLLKPVIVLPTLMVKSRDQLESILIHELIHVKRWDCLYRLLAMVGMAFYWFNPLFHRAKHLLFEVQEQACDDWTVTTTGNSESYADTLLNVATQLQPRPAMALGMDMAHKAQVMERVNRIITLGGHVTPRVGRVSALVMAVVFIGGATAIGSLTTTKVDHKEKKVVFEGGVAITDTSDVSQRELPIKMRDGRLWWRGEKGLYLQDGDSWQKFTLPEGGSLNYINAFMQARNGSMWFAGAYKARPAIANFSGKTWRIWNRISKLGDRGFGSNFAEDLDGGIWIRTRHETITTRGGYDRIKGGNGVWHFDGETWHNYTVKDGLIHNRVYDVVADPKGGVWLATLRGLSHYKDGKWTSHIVDNVPVDGVRNGNIYEGRKVYDILFDRTGTLWTVHGSHRGRTITRNKGGISSFDGTAWTHYDAHGGLPISAFRDVQQTKNGDLWFGTHRGDQTVVEARGLVRYKDGMWLRFTRKHGISGDYVCICGLVEKGDGSFYFSISRSNDISYRPPIDHLASISGKVIDQRNSQPVANMGIWVEYDDGEVHAGTVTDENGHYRVEVTPGSYRVRVASKNVVEPVTVEAKPEDKIEDVDLVLLNSRRISGRVLDTSDNPIANAVVVISDDSSEDRRLYPQVVTTDANGMFEGWQVSGSKTTFEVAAEEYAQTAREVKNAIEEQVVIRVKKGTIFRGRIADELGKPVIWARVGLGPAPDPETKGHTLPLLPFQRNTYTDASGLFALNDVEGGHVWANHSDIGLVSQKIMSADSVVDIQVERLRLFSISGLVSLNEDPVEELRITAFSREKSSGPIRPKTVHPDTNGTYRLDDLEPGKYHISVSAPEIVKREGRTIVIRRTIQSRTQVIEDRDITLNFEPLGDARITGVATYKGEPVSGVYVSSRVLADDPMKSVSVSSIQTNKEGQFELRDLPQAQIGIRFFSSPSSRKRWSRVDTIDLTDKKELSYQAELDMEVSVGDIAPEFEAKQLGGSTFRLADYRGKKAVLINFWATRCNPCVDEIPTIKSIAETYRNQGLEVVGVSIDREEKALRDFVKKERLSYVQTFDKEKTWAIAKSYGVWGFPSVFLIDKNGVINALNLRGGRTEVAVKALLTTGTTDG